MTTPTLLFFAQLKYFLFKYLGQFSVIISIQLAGFIKAEVAKLVYALDLGSSAARRESSSLSFRTKHDQEFSILRIQRWSSSMYGPQVPESNRMKRKSNAGIY